MEKLKYTLIKNNTQYKMYCNYLEELLLSENHDFQDEIDLLTLLIEKWDKEHNTLKESNPVELILALMEENNLKAKDLVSILNLSKGTVSKILNYQKGLSKETIRKLSSYFKLSQEAFNRPYKLTHEVNRQYKYGSLMNKKKNMVKA
ncbi:MAG: helix-turn-helix domain-containing protein [Bacteroidales bacterium]|nr:helix-turn-helix domain-containing protein [Bacteroidales bacterium]